MWAMLPLGGSFWLVHAHRHSADAGAHPARHRAFGQHRAHDLPLHRHDPDLDRLHRRRSSRFCGLPSCRTLWPPESCPAKTDPQEILDRLIARRARRGRRRGRRAAGGERVRQRVLPPRQARRCRARRKSPIWALRVFVGERVAFVSSTDLLEAGARANCPSAPWRWRSSRRKTNSPAWRPRELLATKFPIARYRRRERAFRRNADRARQTRRRRGDGRARHHQFRRRRRELRRAAAIALATSDGFFGRYAATSHSIGVAVLAGEGTGMERDYESASARHAADLESAEAVGKRAGERTIARLNPRKAKSQALPVVYDPRVSAPDWWAISRARFPARPSRAA